MTEHITVSRELLRHALQAHRAMREWIKAVPEPSISMPGTDGDWLDSVEGMLHTALEQPAVEPYGWHVTGSNELLRGEYAQSDAESDAERCGGTAVALYTAPQQPADVPLLTKTEIVKCAFSPGGNEWLLGFARAIEQLVRQKAGLK